MKPQDSGDVSLFRFQSISEESVTIDLLNGGWNWYGTGSTSTPRDLDSSWSFVEMFLCVCYTWYDSNDRNSSHNCSIPSKNLILMSIAMICIRREKDINSTSSNS